MHVVVENRISAPGALWRAVAGWLVMGIGLGAASAVGSATALAPKYQQAVTAAICLVIVVAGILLLRKVIDRGDLAGIGAGRVFPQGLGLFALGLGVTFAVAAVVLGGGGYGLIHPGAVDPAKLLTFLALNAVVAMALEAIPEELTFRGYVFSTLKRRLSTWVSVIVQIALFATIMAVVNPVGSAVAVALGGEATPFRLAPEGTPVPDYLILMVCFGLALTATRIATGSVYTTMGLHLAFLTTNRLIFDNANRDTGWKVDAEPDAVLLVPVYLLLIALIFTIVAVVKRRKAKRQSLLSSFGFSAIHSSIVSSRSALNSSSVVVSGLPSGMTSKDSPPSILVSDGSRTVFIELGLTPRSAKAMSTGV